MENCKCKKLKSRNKTIAKEINHEIIVYLDEELKKNLEKWKENMSEQDSFAPNVKDIEKCTRGLVEKFESPVQGIDVRISFYCSSFFFL